MTTSGKNLARRRATKRLGLLVLGGVLVSVGGGVWLPAAAGEVPAFAPGMINHMQQMRRFNNADTGSQPTPSVIPRLSADPNPAGAVGTFQPNRTTFTSNNAFFKDL